MTKPEIEQLAKKVRKPDEMLALSINAEKAGMMSTADRLARLADEIWEQQRRNKK